LAAWIDLYLFPVVDFVVFDVIISFQDVSGWKLGKRMRNMLLAQKRISYKFTENLTINKIIMLESLLNGIS